MACDRPVEKAGTRIFKKSTPYGKLTIYLGKRDFFDHVTHVDPVEGVVLIDPDYVKDRKVFVRLHAAFRYGQDDSGLLDLAYHSDVYRSTEQAYPQLSGQPIATRLQDRLMRKLGPSAYPFSFQLPAFAASSVTVNTLGSDSSKHCRIDYELKAYISDSVDEKPQRRNLVRMVIRKLTYAPEKPGPQPSVEVCRDFLMSIGSLRAEVSLDKLNYHHGETICVNVLVDNNSNRSVKKIKLSVRQFAQISVHSVGSYKTIICESQSEEGFPILPCQTGWCKVYQLHPQLAPIRDKLGVAMDGDLKQESTNLASSTIDPPLQTHTTSPGIVITYKVKVRLILGFGVSDVCLELPFTLTHANPEDHSSSDDLPNEPECFDDSSTHSPSSHISHTPPLRNESVLNESHNPSLVSAGAVLHNTVSPLSNGDMNGHEKINTSSPFNPIDSINSPVSINHHSYSSPTIMKNPFCSPFVHHIPATAVSTAVSVSQSIISKDDLIFEDFARLRLQTVTANH